SPSRPCRGLRSAGAPPSRAAQTPSPLPTPRGTDPAARRRLRAYRWGPACGTQPSRRGRGGARLSCLINAKFWFGELGAEIYMQYVYSARGAARGLGPEPSVNVTRLSTRARL